MVSFAFIDLLHLVSLAHFDCFALGHPIIAMADWSFGLAYVDCLCWALVVFFPGLLYGEFMTARVVLVYSLGYACLADWMPGHWLLCRLAVGRLNRISF